jgi:hypothetical protein
VRAARLCEPRYVRAVSSLASQAGVHPGRGTQNALTPLRKIDRLYVVGAGASCPYGLPTLKTLTWELCNFLTGAIRLSGETLNLIGIDEARGADWKSDVYRRLQQVKGLVMPDTVNILLVHFPPVFYFVSELGIGIDLTLAGHTHG